MATIIAAPVVASSVDAHWTFERMLDPRDVAGGVPPGGGADRLLIGFRQDQLGAVGSSRISRHLPSTSAAPHHHGTIHISPTLEYIERAYDDAKYGRPSEEPVLEITLPSAVDPSIAPPGKHVMSIFVQYAPYKLAAGKSWDDMKESFADRCLQVLARYAPNMHEDRRASAGAQSAGPGADVSALRAATSCKGPCTSISCTACGRWPAGPTIARRFAGCTCVVPRVIRAVA